jgi:hypothetical protein
VAEADAVRNRRSPFFSRQRATSISAPRASTSKPRSSASMTSARVCTASRRSSPRLSASWRASMRSASEITKRSIDSSAVGSSARLEWIGHSFGEALMPTRIGATRAGLNGPPVGERKRP